MSAMLSRETELLLEERAKILGLDSADQLLWYALDAFESNLFSPEELDDETWAAIERTDAQPDISVVDAEHRIFNRVGEKYRDAVKDRRSTGG